MQTRPELVKKWAPILEHESLSPIKDNYRKEVTAVLLENQEKAMREEGSMSMGLYETHANAGGSSIALGSAGWAAGATTAAVQGYDPVLISLVRRAMPQMIAYDICGVQPMTQPTGLIFAMKSRYTSQNGAEALVNEANTQFSGSASLFDGTGTPASGTQSALTDIFNATTGYGMTTAEGEATTFAEMAFSIEKTSVTAQTRALKAEYTDELAQDLKSVHGLDAAAELSNILTQEILAEINREVVRRVYISAKVGAQTGTAVAGSFDLDIDSNGRWSVEKFKGLLFQIEREANAVGQLTRRGKANFIITSADVASALAMAGVLDYAPALSTSLNVDDTSTTFAGILNGRYKVYVDPYAANSSATQFFVAGYKGSSAFDAGMFYCPYVPLQLVRATDPNTFQPKIGFKTRYGIASNPFAVADYTGPQDPNGLYANANSYYRKVAVANLM
jgi:hypothetical protein